MFPEPEVKKSWIVSCWPNFSPTVRSPTRFGPRMKKTPNARRPKFKSAALPLYAIISPDEKTLAIFASLTRNKQEFIGFLQRGASRFEQQTARR